MPGKVELQRGAGLAPGRVRRGRRRPCTGKAGTWGATTARGQCSCGGRRGRMTATASPWRRPGWRRGRRRTGPARRAPATVPDQPGVHERRDARRRAAQRQELLG
jgi:hypothetical protein